MDVLHFFETRGQVQHSTVLKWPLQCKKKYYKGVQIVVHAALTLQLIAFRLLAHQ